MFFGFLCMSSSSALAADSHTDERKSMSFSLNEQGYQFEQVKTVKGAGEFEHSDSFSVEIDGVVAKNIISIKGIGAEGGTYGAEAPNAASNQPELKGDVRLQISREFHLTKAMSTWETAVLEGKNDHKTLTVLVYKNAAKEPARADFTDCRPIKYIGPVDKSMGSSHAIESIEIYCTHWQAELN